RRAGASTFQAGAWRHSSSAHAAPGAAWPPPMRAPSTPVTRRSRWHGGAPPAPVRSRRRATAAAPELRGCCAQFRCASLVGASAATYTPCGELAWDATGMRTAPAHTAIRNLLHRRATAWRGRLRALGALLLLFCTPAAATRVDFYFQPLEGEPGLAQNSVNA